MSAKNLFLFVLVCLSLDGTAAVSGTGNCSSCIFPHHQQINNSHLKKLEPLCGYRYSVDDDSKHFKYSVGICHPATMDGVAGVGVSQVDKNNRLFSIGRYDEADIIAGKNWIMLEYNKGDSYANSCNKTGRKAIIMITCDPSVKTNNDVKLRFVHEDNNKLDDCYYLFEIEHASACSPVEIVEVPSYLSAGSLFCIVLFTTIFAYLLFGFLFQRYVRKAKGVQQIPNYHFWRELGRLLADGCNFVCRCGEKPDDPNNYRSLGQREDARDHVDVDDNLLGM